MATCDSISDMKKEAKSLQKLNKKKIHTMYKMISSKTKTEQQKYHKHLTRLHDEYERRSNKLIAKMDRCGLFK